MQRLTHNQILAYHYWITSRHRLRVNPANFNPLNNLSRIPLNLQDYPVPHLVNHPCSINDWHAQANDEVVSRLCSELPCVCEQVGFLKHGSIDASVFFSHVEYLKNTPKECSFKYVKHFLANISWQLEIAIC